MIFDADMSYLFPFGEKLVKFQDLIPKSLKMGEYSKNGERIERERSLCFILKSTYVYFIISHWLNQEKSPLVIRKRRIAFFEK